jgi:hypothetical protein
MTRPATFAVERRRGWTETADTPPRDPADMWDERRAGDVRMEKMRPGSAGRTRLTVQGWYAAFRSSEPGGVRYEIVDGGVVSPIADAQWADWAADGRLLVATIDGRLQIRDGEAGRLAVGWEVDLAALAPGPAPPPDEARRW